MRSLHASRRYHFVVRAHEWLDKRSITGERSKDPRRVAFTGHVRWALSRDRHWTKTAPIFCSRLSTVVLRKVERGRFRPRERTLIPLVPETLVHYPLGEKSGLDRDLQERLRVLVRDGQQSPGWTRWSATALFPLLECSNRHAKQTRELRLGQTNLLSGRRHRWEVVNTTGLASLELANAFQNLHANAAMLVLSPTSTVTPIILADFGRARVAACV